MRYLTADELVAINSRLAIRVGKQPGIKNVDQLDKIIAVPQSNAYDQSLHEMVANKTGFLLDAIISGKPFVNMNLQTAAIAVASLADLNDYELTFTDDELVALVNRDNNKEVEATELFTIFNNHLKQK